jgi:hypothetical protein
MTTSLLQRFIYWLNADTIFFRSCMFIVGGCIFFGFTWIALNEWPIQDSLIWFFLAPLGAFGLGLILISLFASDHKFERNLALLSDGGELPAMLFFVLVMFVAIPLTMAIRLAKKPLT